MTNTVDLSGRQFGEFVLRERIGEGSFGAVYCCDQPLLGREAVVKVLHPKLHHDDVSVQRFLREAQLASRLDHPYAAHVYAFGLEEHERLLWIAMERVQGVTLKSWLRDHGPMSLEQFVPFFECLAEVVQTTHERGIVHRDLKPSNIMVIERAGRLLPKLLDLGVAKLLGDAVLPAVTQDIIRRAISAELALEPSPRTCKPGVGAQTLTGKWIPPRREPVSQPPSTLSTVGSDSSVAHREGRSWLTSDDATVGSPPYMSPEQWTNAVTVGPASDLYSLAVVAFEALTGRRPFDGDTLGDYAELHCQGKVPSLPAGFPSALDQMFQRALAKRPEERLSTALEMARALRAASGVGTSWADLPRIDAGVRDRWLAHAPQPLADSIAVLDGARNAHQAHIAIQELARHLVRYLLAVTLAARSQKPAHDGHGDPALLELVRALDRRELRMAERIQLLRLLLRPLISHRDAHPIPELVDLATPGPDGTDALEPILSLHSSIDHAGTDDVIRSRIARLIPELTEVLRKLSFVLDYPLIVPRDGAAERWTGLRPLERASTAVSGGELADGHPTLLDRDGQVRIDLWPLVQAVPPHDGAEPDMFVFDGKSQHGAVMVAAATGLEHHDALAQAWVAAHVIAEIETKARMRAQVRVAAHQWQDRSRSDALLWRGEVLEELERWTRHTSEPRLNELETSFVTASRRVARRARWIRRSLIAAGVVAALTVVEYRASLQTHMAEKIATESEIEQGRLALLHGESSEAVHHLEQAYQRGDRSPGVTFMLARALQPRMSELARLTSSYGRMWSAAFSPDGKQVVTTDDRSARVWDAESSRLLFTLRHDDTVYQAAYSPDGARIITAGADGTVRVWNARTGAPIRELTYQQPGEEPRRYYAVAASSHFVAAIDTMGRAAQVWDPDTGAQIADLPNDASEAAALVLSADGRWLATSGGNDVRVFETSTWTLAVTIPGPRVRSLSFDPSGPRLAVGTYNGEASIWDIPKGTRARVLREAGESVDAIAFSRDGGLVATASRDGAEQVWDAASGGLRIQFNSHHSKIYAIEFAPTANLVLSAGADGAVVVSNVATGLPVARLEGPDGLVFAAHFDPLSHRVVGASWDGTARIWNATSPYLHWDSPPIGADCDTAESLAPDQRFIAISCERHGTRVWDTTRGVQLAELPAVTPVGGSYDAAFPALSAAGDRAAIARGDSVEIYALPGGQLVRTIAHRAAVHAVAFAPTGHDLITGSIDGSVLITADGREPIALPPMPGGIDAVAILADGRVVVADASNRLRIMDRGRSTVVAELASPFRVRSLRPSPDGARMIALSTRAIQAPPALWDLERYRLLRRLEGHIGRVFAARFATSGHGIVTAGSDGTVRLWDAGNGDLRRTYRGDWHFLADATLSPDGAIVVAGSSDGLLRFWDASSARLLWTLQAHKSYVVGVHYEGSDIVTRSLAGEIARWTLPPSQRIVEACHQTTCASAVLTEM